jgi:hypothetical protein
VAVEIGRLFLRLDLRLDLEFKKEALESVLAPSFLSLKGSPQSQ